MKKPLRFAGKITEWNDERGFGFVTPNGGGERAFVHIKAFQRGSRRPVDGDLISYLPVQDAQGRLQACEIRHAGQKIQPEPHPSRFPRAIMGGLALLMVTVLAAAKAIPLILAGAYCVFSLLSYGLYALDKAAARKGTQRTPEKHLHMIDLLGGWPGALIAQQQFHHKTIKQPFQFLFWITVVLNLGSVWWLVSSGLINELPLWMPR